jgi:hypothetical protein
MNKLREIIEAFIYTGKDKTGLDLTLLDIKELIIIYNELVTYQHKPIETINTNVFCVINGFTDIRIAKHGTGWIID